VGNGIFWSEIGSGFGDAGGTPPPKIPGSTPRGSLPSKHFGWQTAPGGVLPGIFGGGVSPASSNPDPILFYIHIYVFRE